MKSTFFTLFLVVLVSLLPFLAEAQEVTSVSDSVPALTAKKAKKVLPVELTKETFRQRVMDYEAHPKEWVYAGDKPAVIDFYATWCGPCKQVAPIFQQLASEYAGKVDVYKIDIDRQPELAALFGVRSIPTVLFIPMEGLPQKAVGAMPKSSYEEAIHEVLLVP